MHKIKTLLKKSLLALVVLGALTSYFGGQALAIAPPLPAGCYDKIGSDFKKASRCTTEGQARAVSAPLNKCFLLSSGSSPTSAIVVNKEISCTTGEAVGCTGAECPTPTTSAECVEAGGTWEYIGGGSVLGCDLSAVGTDPGTDPAPANNASPAPVDSKCPINDPATANANGCCLANDLNGDNCGIIKYVNIAFNFVSGGVTLAIIGNIIFAGIQYSTAQGDPSAVGKSKKRLRDAVIAFLMFLSLYGFIQWLIPGGVF